MVTSLRITLGVLALALVGAGSAHAAPGPPLLEPAAALTRALECSGSLSAGPRPPVLLVHGTGSSAAESWSWGYRRALPAQGFPTCTVRLPERGLMDIQRNVEYVVSAVRLMHHEAGRKISIIGLSQGGLLPPLALEFWPDLAAMVDDYLGLAPVTQHGSRFFDSECANGCPPAGSQFRTSSRILAAFGRRALPAGPSYTTVSTSTDEVLTPSPSASHLPGARNLVIQDQCPGRSVAHFAMAGDAVAFAYALDALTHPGPGSADRVADSVCNQRILPGGNEQDLADLLTAIFTGVVEAEASTAQPTTVEPRLRCYLLVSCRDPDARGRLLAAARAKPRSGKLALRLRTQAPGELRIVLQRRRTKLVRPLDVEAGARQVTIGALRRGRYLARLEARPDGYSRFSPERSFRVLVRR